MDECKNCEKYPAHVGKCTSANWYCKYFPYEMPYGKRIDMKTESKHECNGLGYECCESCDEPCPYR